MFGKQDLFDDTELHDESWQKCSMMTNKFAPLHSTRQVLQKALSCYYEALSMGMLEQKDIGGKCTRYKVQISYASTSVLTERASWALCQCCESKKAPPSFLITIQQWCKVPHFCHDQWNFGIGYSTACYHTLHIRPTKQNLCNFTVGNHTKLFYIKVTLWLMIYPYQGRLSTRLQGIILLMSDKTTCKVPASVECYK